MICKGADRGRGYSHQANSAISTMPTAIVASTIFHGCQRRRASES